MAAPAKPPAKAAAGKKVPSPAKKVPPAGKKANPFGKQAAAAEPAPGGKASPSGTGNGNIMRGGRKTGS